jgi:hypothetical protein
MGQVTHQLWLLPTHQPTFKDSYTTNNKTTSTSGQPTKNQNSYKKNPVLASFPIDLAKYANY